jgi:hypothetical protein
MQFRSKKPLSCRNDSSATLRTRQEGLKPRKGSHGIVHGRGLCNHPFFVGSTILSGLSRSGRSPRLRLLLRNR